MRLLGAELIKLGRPLTHVTHVLDKLGLCDRVHAVVHGYERGLIEPGRAG